MHLPVRVPADVWAAWRASQSEYQNRKVDHLERTGAIVVWRVKNVPEPFVEVEGSGVPSITSLDQPEKPWQPPYQFSWANPSPYADRARLLYGQSIFTTVFRESWL